MTVVRWLTALLAATVALTFALPAVAKVVRLEISRTDPYGSFLAGDYVRMEGRVFGELAADENFPELTRLPEIPGERWNTRRPSPSSCRKMRATVMALCCSTLPIEGGDHKPSTTKPSDHRTAMRR